MRPSRILAKLRRGEASFVTALHLNDPAVFELASLLGFDGIWLDMEHQARSMQTAAQLMRGARVGGSDVMCRIAKGEFLRMSRALEAGAHGIMYPRCDDAAEAREVVRWAKFAPLGTRGVDSAGADNPFLLTPLVDYLKQANEQTFVVIQIEDAAALDKAGEIAAVDGVDVLFFGPGDFSILCGFAGQFNDVRIEDAMKRISDAARKAGKHWGMPCFTPEHAQKVYDLGGRFLAHGSDIGSLKNAMEDIQKRFSPVGVKFERRV
jgi:4-hydroxy-2-oxoheptanedioate aldolase